MRTLPIEHPSHNGNGTLRVGHGNDCVLVEIDSITYAGIVFTSEQADVLWRSIRQQLRYAREAAVKSWAEGRPGTVS